MFLRFVLKKHVGPLNALKINRAYRNITWAIIGNDNLKNVALGVILFLVVYIIILVYSTKMRYIV
jgi:hypothetical protein